MESLFGALFWLSFGTIHFCIISGPSFVVGLVAGIAVKLRKPPRTDQNDGSPGYKLTKACLIASILLSVASFLIALCNLSSDLQGALVILRSSVFALHGLLFGFHFVADALIADRWARVGWILFFYYGLTFLIAIPILILSIDHVGLPSPE